MQTEQELRGDAADAALTRGLDKARPSIYRDRAAPPDVAPASSRVVGVTARLSKLGHAAESRDEVVEVLHENQPLKSASPGKLRIKRSNVNAPCVTQYAKLVGMEPHERLKWARKRQGRYDTATDAARAFGWPVSTYLGHENGDRKPSRKAAEKYAKAYGVRWEWLLTGSGSPTANNRVSVVGKVGAGGSILTDLEQIPPDGLYEIETPIEIPDDSIAFEVDGTSMFPRYDPGDVVICRREGMDISEVIGWEGAIRTSDGQRYLKRVVQGSAPKTFDLESYNAPVIRGVGIEWASRVAVVIRRSDWSRMNKKSQQNLVKKLKAIAKNR